MAIDSPMRASLAYSTDSSRITCITLQHETPEFYLDDLSVDALAQMTGITQYWVTPAWFCVKNAEDEVLCLHSKDMASYPQDKVQAALDAAETEHANAPKVKLPAALTAQVLARVKVLAETLPGNLQRIQVGLSEAGMTLFGNSVAGSVEHLVEWDANSKPQSWPGEVKVWLDPTFLEAHLGSQMEISISSNEPRTVRFASGNFTQVVGTVTGGK